MLKNDFRDDMFPGARRYDLINNEDGTVSLNDKTTYTQEGDRFGASEVNAITRQLNSLVGLNPSSALRYFEQGETLLQFVDSCTTNTTKTHFVGNPWLVDAPLKKEFIAEVYVGDGYRKFLIVHSYSGAGREGTYARKFFRGAWVGEWTNEMAELKKSVSDDKVLGSRCHHCQRSGYEPRELI